MLSLNLLDACSSSNPEFFTAARTIVLSSHKFLGNCFSAKLFCFNVINDSAIFSLYPAANNTSLSYCNFSEAYFRTLPSCLTAVKTTSLSFFNSSTTYFSKSGLFFIFSIINSLGKYSISSDELISLAISAKAVFLASFSSLVIIFLLYRYLIS